jgi:uncharacterized protein YggE
MQIKSDISEKTMLVFSIGWAQLSEKRKGDTMNKMRAAVVVFFLLTAPLISFASNEKSTIEVKGTAYSTVKPDIAHFILKISGSGENYESSTGQAESKVEEMKKIFNEIMGLIPDVSEVKREYAPQNIFSEGDYMEIQKEYFKNMAQAMKGEEIENIKDQKGKEMTTSIFVYFPALGIEEQNIVKLKSTLAEHEIAFNKSNIFDFTQNFDINKSSILFGLQTSSHYLESLSREAYREARQKAEVIAKSTNRNNVTVLKISGCGASLEGPVNASNINEHIGKDLGPLSADPGRLVIKFSSDYEFVAE